MKLCQMKKNYRDQTYFYQNISKGLWLDYPEVLTVNYSAEINFNKTNL